jgi:hypothetical protein
MVSKLARSSTSTPKAFRKPVADVDQEHLRDLISNYCVEVGFADCFNFFSYANATRQQAIKGSDLVCV